MPTVAMGDAYEEKASYVVKKKWTPFYSGGPIRSIQDGDKFICCCGDQLKIMTSQTGDVHGSIDLEGDDVTCFYVTPDEKFVITSSRSSLLKQWSLETLECERTWKAIHTSPVISMHCDATSTLLATGGSDGSVKVWDLYRKYCTHNLRFPASVINAVRFHPTKMLLITASSDYKIRVWDLRTSRCVRVLDGHVSTITCLLFATDDIMLSGGRDKVVCMWKGFGGEDISKIAEQPYRVVPTYESVESVMMIEDTLKFIIGGSKGNLSMWNGETSQCEMKQSEEKEDKVDVEITHALPLYKRGEIITSYSDLTIEFVAMDTLDVKKRFAGDINEVTGVHLVGKDFKQIAVVMNSANIKVFEQESSTYQLLKGHKDFITNITVFKDGSGFVSGSRDGSIALWFIDEQTGVITCGVRADAHNSSISSLAMSQMKSTFFLTGSEDNTIKSWRCVKMKKSGLKLKCDKTQFAHEMTVNSIHISPNDGLAVTGSQDKTVKLWSLPELTCEHTFTGHTKGVWCVKFSPVDKVVASSSADGTVKIWAVDMLNCIRTIQGHDCSILSLVFIKRGTQIVTSGSDGLIKLWEMKTSECMLTLDAHDSNIESLSANEDGSVLVSGSLDGTFIQWEDQSELVMAESRKEYEDRMLMFEELQNLLQEKQVSKALKLAIRLEQPATALKVLKQLNCDAEMLEKSLGTLSLTKAAVLVKFAAVWNTNSRNSNEAQVVLQYLLSTLTTEELLSFDDVIPNIRGMIAYTERHFARLSRLQQQVSFIDYTLHQMKFD